MSSGPWQAVITLQGRPAVRWWMLRAPDIMGGRLPFPTDALHHGLKSVDCRMRGELAVCQASCQSPAKHLNLESSNRSCESCFCKDPQQL